MKVISRFPNILLAIVLTLTIILSSTEPAKAIPPDPIDTDPIGEVPFVPPENGFYWSVPDRFGSDENSDGMIDYHWDADLMIYDPTYVHPSEYTVNFDGCRSEAEYWSGISENTYQWRFLYPGDAEDAPGVVMQGNECRVVKTFPAQGTYRARLTIRRPDNSVVLDSQGRGDPFHQDVVVKDYLIISIGDSYGSGEGNPDIDQESTWMGPIVGWIQLSPPRWQDTRCHRSAWAGPAQAALGIERSDRRTSVTFLSFACSGATIDTPFWQGNDPNKYLGAGILSPYRGAEVPDDVPYHESAYIPSQISQVRNAQVRNAAETRMIDALIISGGGNDIRFGTVAESCLLNGDCWNTAYGAEVPDGNLYRLDTLVGRAMAALPAKFEQLATEINTLDVANVFITEYPDSTRTDTPNAPNVMESYCYMLDDVFGSIAVSIDPFETKMAAELALNQLNQTVSGAAQRHGWVFVDGIADPFRTDSNGKGHGYCASDSWIRRAIDSIMIQGPYWTIFTKGTLHPTIRGHQVYAERLREEMLPRLNPNLPNTPPPVFNTSFTSGLSASRQGENGWLTGRCIGSVCTSDQAVLTVEAAARGLGTVLSGARVTVNGVEGCSGVPGVSCLTSTGTGQTNYAWAFKFTQTGVYRMQFLAKDSNLQVSTFAYEVRVDLNDPIVSASVSPDSPNSTGWHTAPVTVSFSGDDPSGLSGLAKIEYSLDSTPGQTEPEGSLTITENGVHTLTYQAVDQAGRRSPQQSLSFQIDQDAPTTTPALTASGSDYASGRWTKHDISVTLNAVDNEGGSGVSRMVYSATGAQAFQETVAESAQAQFSITMEGETTLNFEAEDAAGNREPVQSAVLRIDRTPPTFTCDDADGAWHASDVIISCTANDSGAGFELGATTSFTLTTNVPEGVETDNASTNSYQVCDLAGNCANVPAISGIKVDKKAPEITVTAPTNSTYTLNEAVLSNYTCADNGSGMAVCEGTVPSGSLIDTSVVGEQAFQVSATDQAGNSSSLSASYQVSYKVCLLYDTTKSYKVGSTVPLRLQVCDDASTDQSSASIIVTAQGLTKVDNTSSGTLADTGNSNPDNNFRFDTTLPGFVYNLSTKSLSSGTWALRFIVTGDPMVHTLYFDLR